MCLCSYDCDFCCIIHQGLMAHNCIIPRRVATISVFCTFVSTITYPPPHIHCLFFNTAVEHNNTAISHIVLSFHSWKVKVEQFNCLSLPLKEHSIKNQLRWELYYLYHEAHVGNSPSLIFLPNFFPVKPQIRKAKYDQGLKGDRRMKKIISKKSQDTVS
jgi:hypothetical protein